MPIFHQPFTIFDIETTGLNPKLGHRIVEIGAVRFEGENMDGARTFQSLINPERSIPPNASRVHGISSWELLSAPTSMEALPAFLRFAEASILVAHNAAFDLSFLEVEKESCWGYVELPECFCTLELSKYLFPRETQHHLDGVATRLGLSAPPGRHRALPDAQLTAEVFLKLLSKGEFMTIQDLRRAASPLAACR
jgi:DNA polymerase-3 subunit epsilon